MCLGVMILKGSLRVSFYMSYENKMRGDFLLLLVQSNVIEWGFLVEFVPKLGSP